MAEFDELFYKSKVLIENARTTMGVMVNMVTVFTCYCLGKYMIEEEQHGEERAEYGAKVLDSLSDFLTKEYGRGYSRSNLAGMRKFYLTYRNRDSEIVQSGIGQLGLMQKNGIVQSTIGQLALGCQDFPFKLSWTHYQLLMTIDNEEERNFYELEAIKGVWNVKTLKRQYHSSLFERLALSRDKTNVMALATKGAIISIWI